MMVRHFKPGFPRLYGDYFAREAKTVSASDHLEPSYGPRLTTADFQTLDGVGC